MHLVYKLVLCVFIVLIIGVIVYFLVLHSNNNNNCDDPSTIIFGPTGVDDPRSGPGQGQGQDTDIDESKLAYTITVSQSEDGDFNTIQDAVDSIHTEHHKGHKWIRILVQPGIYNEQVDIPEDKTCIVLQGHQSKDTIITYNAHAQTDTSPTIKIKADNVVVKGITFENSYVKKIKGQSVGHFSPAVAIMVGGDKVSFYDCSFIGYQDTLWDDHGRHYFKNCYIEGAVDFIWGSAQSFYEGCSINVIDGGFVTAQGRDSRNDPGGYVFNNCNVYGDGNALLGRAYGPNSRVIFINSVLSQVVLPQGWDIWHQHGHEGEIVYAEVNCKGPGASSASRVPWMKKLNGGDLSQYTLTSFVNQDAWISKQPLH